MELKDLLALLVKDPRLMAGMTDFVKEAEAAANASLPQPRGRSPTPRQLGTDQDGATSATAGKEPTAPQSQSQSPRKSRSRSPRQSKSRSRSRSRPQSKSKSRSRSRSESPPPRSPTRKKNNSCPSKPPPRRSDEEDSDGAKAPSRNATPSPHRSSPRRQASPRRSTSPRKRQTNNSKRQRTPPPPPPRQYKKINGEKVECAYTSGEDGNRGGRKGARRTRMEELRTRKAKNQQVCNQGHWFGRLHGGWFNPYSTDTVNEKLCVRIPRPKGQAGRGDFILHEAMGLTDDYDWFLDVRGDVRKACHTNRPLNADPEARITWKGYSSGDRKKIFDYLYSRYPFLFHFRDESGDDCWAVRDMAQQYLVQSKSYASKKPRSRYLRRNASHGDEGEGRGGEDDSDEEDREANKNSAKKGDYHLNAGASRGSSFDKNPPDNTSSKGGPSLPPATSSLSDARDARHADKIVALEKERATQNKGGDARQKGSSGTQKHGDSSWASKASAGRKEKEREKEKGTTQRKSTTSDTTGRTSGSGEGGKRKRQDEAEDEEEVDETAGHLVTKRVNAGSGSATGRAGKGPSSFKPKTKASLLHQTGEKNTAKGTGAGKGKNREPEPEPEVEEEEEEAPKQKRKPRPKMRPPPPVSDEEEDGDTGSRIISATRMVVVPGRDRVRVRQPKD